MSNSFPQVPAGLQLSSVQYTLSFTAGSVPVSPDPSAVSVSLGGALQALNSPGSVQYAFGTPGAFGAFDQDVVEAGLRQVVTDVCQLIATVSGQQLAAVQARAVITRMWNWADQAGDSASYTDTLSYP